MKFTQKQIYAGVNVLKEYLNNTPLKGKYNGVPSYEIVMNILRAVESVEQAEMAKEFLREEWKREVENVYPSDHYKQDPIKQY